MTWACLYYYVTTIYHSCYSNNNNNNNRWLRKGNLKRETESLLIVAQGNAIKTNHVKAKIKYNNKADVGYVVIYMTHSITW